MKKILAVSSVFAVVAGIVLVVGGIWGIRFTYQNIAQENIVTPADAAIPEAPVRGPFTLKAQADIIRFHTLKATGGKTYAEMPRQIPKLDEDGKEVIGVDGKPVMVENTARDMWITATTLRTALHLGILTYVFSGFIILFGFVSIWTGLVFRALARRERNA
ncbi:MAG: hypothetical protein Q7S89_01265 [bacterium]|nr:hypothetical protein [bacterium]